MYHLTYKNERVKTGERERERERERACTKINKTEPSFVKKVLDAFAKVCSMGASPVPKDFREPTLYSVSQFPTCLGTILHHESISCLIK